MDRPEPIWETIYKADRRKHCHRCRACNRTIKSGESVLMAYVKRGTVAIHKECGETPITGTASNYRDNMTAWGLGGLKSRGWPVPELDTHYQT